MTSALPESPDLSEVFASPDLSLWREAAVAALKGADFEKTLYTRSLEGLTLQPLYTAADTGARADGRRPAARGWTMAQAIEEARPEAFARALSEDSEQGLEGLLLDLDALAPESPSAWQQALAPFDPQQLGLHLRSRRPIAGLIALESLAQPPLTGSFGSDGLAELAKHGKLDLHRHFDDLAFVIGRLPAGMPGVGIDATPYAEAGAHAAQELAYAAAALTETVQQLAERGVAPAQSLAQAHLTLSVGPAFFMELAKFRAARVLLRRIATAYGVNLEPVLHARTSRIGLTRYDAYSNFLRQTIAALAAVLGGAQVLSTGGYNEPSGPSDAFARRLARNLQLILRHEVKLDRLIDPVGGSYFIESLTTELAAAAWSEFQRIEAAGGMAAALPAGLPQAAISATAAERQRRVDTRRQPLVGATAYVNPAESLSEAEPALAPSAELAPLELPQDAESAFATGREAFAGGAAWPSLVQALAGQHETAARQLAPLRLAAGFEALRQQSELRPRKLLLLPLNALSEAKPRLDFSRSLLEVGGFRPEIAAAVTDASSAVAALAEFAPEFAPEVVVLCGTDAAYAASAAAVASALRAAHPELKIGLAGRPGEQESTWRAAGLNFFVYLGCDAQAVLSDLLGAN